MKLALLLFFESDYQQNELTEKYLFKIVVEHSELRFLVYSLKVKVYVYNKYLRNIRLLSLQI